MEKDYGLVSVIIPAYNREGLIKDCIMSVLNQSYRNIEVIVVDDCSSDKTADVVDSIEDDRLLKCIRLEKNSGACYARNTGASIASGKYVAFQDSDDFWNEDKIEKQVAFLENGNYDFVFCGMTRVNGDVTTNIPIRNFDENADPVYQLLYDNLISTQCMFMTKEAFDKVKFDEEIKRYQDWDFVIRAAKILKIGYLAESLVHSEIQPDSISKRASRYEALKVIFDKYEADIRKSKLLLARFYKKMGDELCKTSGKDAIKLYRKSLKNKFSAKLIIKCVYLRIKGV